MSGESGRLARIAPAPIGSSSIGSYSFATARYTSTPRPRASRADCQREVRRARRAGASRGRRSSRSLLEPHERRRRTPTCCRPRRAPRPRPRRAAPGSRSSSSSPRACRSASPRVTCGARRDEHSTTTVPGMGADEHPRGRRPRRWRHAGRRAARADGGSGLRGRAARRATARAAAWPQRASRIAGVIAASARSSASTQPHVEVAAVEPDARTVARRSPGRRSVTLVPSTVHRVAAHRLIASACQPRSAASGRARPSGWRAAGSPAA